MSLPNAYPTLRAGPGNNTQVVWDRRMNTTSGFFPRLNALIRHLMSSGEEITVGEEAPSLALTDPEEVYGNLKGLAHSFENAIRRIKYKLNSVMLNIAGAADLLEHLVTREIPNLKNRLAATCDLEGGGRRKRELHRTISQELIHHEKELRTAITEEAEYHATISACCGLFELVRRDSLENRFR